jgi:hypothetical protein
MNIDKLKKFAAALNSKLSESARGQTLATVNLLKAQIEFNNAALEAITGMQQQMEKLEAAQQDQQAARPS